MRILLTFLLVVTAAGCDDNLMLGGVGSAGLPSSDHRSTGPPPTGGPPTGDLRLNELLASNRRGRRDDQGRSSDWIEIHNSGNKPLQLDGYHLTNDLKDLDKWSFPNSRISAGGYRIVWMSGSAHAALPPNALKPSKAPTPFETTLVKPGANWKYVLGGAGQKAFTNKSVKGWTAVDFDDSAFAVGPAGIGYGDDDDATTVPGGTTVVLARHTFTLNEPLGSEALILQVDYDDGFAAYLNGTRVAAASCRDEEEPNLDSLAKDSHDAGTAERFDLSKHSGLLRPGKNVLAIAGLNNSKGSSDLSLAPALGTLATASHASFRLKKSGDTLYLISPDEKLVDQVRYPKQVTDQSLGRVPSTRSSWRYFLTPSPGSSNTGPHRNRPIKSRLSFDPEAAAFKPGDHIRILQQSGTDLDIRFTNDGSAPGASSQLYRDPITLNETTLFRAAAFFGREQVGDIVTATCLVGRQPTLPVMSISLKPEDFTDVHLQKSGKGRGSERPAFLEVFTPTGKRAAATGFGLRLHGGAGRRGDITTKKSYRAYFRGVYGDKRLNYDDIIPNAGVKNFDKLVLRANFGDGHAHGAYIRDQVIRELHADLGGLCSNGSWYVLLVNLKDQGVFNVVERLDDEFFISHLGPGDYDVVKTGDRVISGTRDGWSELRRFIRSKDFSNQANFDELARRVDIENFTAYVILNFWAQNFDWPHNNWYAARRAPQGKWFFLCWDAEWGLGGGDYDPDVDPYAFIDSGGAYGHSMIRALFFAMIGNPGYCKYYQREVRRHLRGALSTANALRHVHRNRDAIAADIEHEFDVRGYDKQHWRGQIAEIESFVQGGGEIFQQYTDAYFSHKNPGRSDDRVALTESADGRRHVLYRTAKGQLRELSSAADGTSWSDKDITAPGKMPTAAGRPSVYSLPQGGRRILYRGEKGHLHELSRPGEDDPPVAWKHNDLTAQLNLPVAGCDPSVVVARGVPHIVYVDQACQAHEVWLDEKWRHHPLPAAPRSATDAVITYTSSALQVTYRTMFGAVCEQNLLLKDAENDKRKWSHRLVFGSPAKGSPRGFSPKSIRHLVFRSAEKWPLRQPFVSGVKTVRERETPIPRSALVHAWYDGKRFWHLEPIENPASEIVGDPCVIHNVPTTRFHFAYRDARGHVIETTFRSEDIPQGGSWQLADPTTLADAPPAAGEPAGLFSARTGSRFYVYRGRDGHLHELRFDGSWTHRDLTAAATGSFSKRSK